MFEYFLSGELVLYGILPPAGNKDLRIFIHFFQLTKHVCRSTIAPSVMYKKGATSPSKSTSALYSINVLSYISDAETHQTEPEDKPVMFQPLLS